VFATQPAVRGRLGAWWGAEPWAHVGMDRLPAQRVGEGQEGGSASSAGRCSQYRAVFGALFSMPGQPGKTVVGEDVWPANAPPQNW
jgi:hypothetical protein